MITLKTAGDYKRYAMVTLIHSEYDTAFWQFKTGWWSNSFNVFIREEAMANGYIAVHFEGDEVIAGLVRQWILNAMEDPHFDSDDVTEWDEYPSDSWQYTICIGIKNRLSVLIEEHERSISL